MIDGLVHRRTVFYSVGNAFVGRGRRGKGGCLRLWGGFLDLFEDVALIEVGGYVGDIALRGVAVGYFLYACVRHYGCSCSVGGEARRRLGRRDDLDAGLVGLSEARKY